jgi:ABC-type multidrug transport system fused ATPase/permease subunit
MDIRDGLHVPTSFPGAFLYSTTFFPRSQPFNSYKSQSIFAIGASGGYTIAAAAFRQAAGRIFVRKLLVYLKNDRRDCILSPLLKLLEAAMDLAVPLVIARMIDRGIAGADRPYLWRMGLLLVGLGLVGLLLAVAAQYFAARASVGFVTRLRQALFAHIQKLSYSQLDRLGGATLLTRMTSDMNQVQTGVNLTLRLVLRSPLVVFGAMAMAFTIDVPSAWSFAVVIPVLFAVVFTIMLTCIPLYKKVQAKLDRVTAMTRENLSGVRVIRAFGRETAQTQAFTATDDALTRMQKFTGRISALMNPLTYILINLAIVWLIHTGAVRVSAGLLGQGAVVALYNYMSQILVELVKLANLILSLTKAAACGNRIQAIFDETPEMTGADTMPEPKQTDTAVCFQHAALRYPGAGEAALRGLDFSVQRGQTIGIIGGTGAGKSTLVNLIPRFYDVTEGSVSVFGTDVRKYPLAALRARIGIVPQKAMLFQGSIRDNLRWGNETASDEALLCAAEAAQAADVIEQKGGLDGLLEQGGRNLSGGQRQRLTIARALVREPEILILDDSASALDYATDARLRQSLRSLSYHPTVFLVSQRAASVRSADRILVLDDGCVADIGTHDELLDRCEVYREIYASQYKKEAQ